MPRPDTKMDITLVNSRRNLPIGKIGIRMEVKDSNGRISTHIDGVMNRWRK